jgi:hypothetical protein
LLQFLDSQVQRLKLPFRVAIRSRERRALDTGQAIQFLSQTPRTTGCQVILRASGKERLLPRRHGLLRQIVRLTSECLAHGSVITFVFQTRTANPIRVHTEV